MALSLGIVQATAGEENVEPNMATPANDPGRKEVQCLPENGPPSEPAAAWCDDGDDANWHDDAIS